MTGETHSDPNAEFLELTTRGGMPTDVVRSATAKAMTEETAARSLSRPLFVPQTEADAFYRDLRSVIDIVHRLPKLLGGLSLGEFGALVGAPAEVLPLLQGAELPEVPLYGRADAYHDGTRFRILELGLSPAIGGAVRTEAVPRVLMEDPNFAPFAERHGVCRPDPMRGMADVLNGMASGVEDGDLVLVEASGALAEWAPAWQQLTAELERHGYPARLAEIGDIERRGGRVYAAGTPVAAFWRLFSLPELAREPTMPDAWPLLHQTTDGAPPIFSPPICDLLNSKACLGLLWRTDVRVGLRPEEIKAIERTVPFTVLTCPGDDALRALLLKRREDTVLKPVGGARGEGTVAGWAATPAHWRSAVTVACDEGGYVAQQRVRPRAELAIDLDDGRIRRWRPLYGAHYGPGGLTGLSARVVGDNGPAVVGVGAANIRLAPVLVFQDKGTPPPGVAR